MTSSLSIGDAAQLVTVPFSFTQLDPLNDDDFLKFAKVRGYPLTHEQLSALHRSRILLPLLRATRDRQTLRAELRRADHIERHRHRSWQPTWYLGTRGVLGRNVAVTWHDPDTEPIVSEARRWLTFDDLRYETSKNVYSPHQAIMLPLASRVLRQTDVVMRGDGTHELRAHSWLTMWQKEATKLRDAVIAATALEARYYPDLVNRYSFSPSAEHEYINWLRQTPAEFFTELLGVDAAWLTMAAAELLELADTIDPLADWLDLIACVAPAQWSRLRGNARTAVDLRVVAEMLLKCRDGLEGNEMPTPEANQSRRELRHLPNRLSKELVLDKVLTDFGLSPHPALVVVLEGKTEMHMWQRVLAYYGISPSEEFIKAIDAHGVDTDLTVLMSYAAPRLEPSKPDGVLEFVRPATRVLVVSDPENKMATPEARESRRSQWVKQLYETIPAELRRPAMREQLDGLVFVETWNDEDESFEFAHFTPREIAQAIRRVHGPHFGKPVDDLQRIVERIHDEGGNLKKFEEAQLRKGELATKLWPILKRKLDRRQSRGTDGSMPIVRIMDRAVRLGSELPRASLFLDGRAPPS